MRFELTQPLAAPADAVARAFASTDLYSALAELPTLGRPEVVRHEPAGDTVRMEVRYRFMGHLSSAARAMLDPDKLSWVEHSTHDLASRTVEFRLVPDHYADRFRSSGRYEIRPVDDGHSIRAVTGEVVVRAMLVGKAVEAAIVSGLRDHLRDETPLVERFVRGS